MLTVLRRLTRTRVMCRCPECGQELVVNAGSVKKQKSCKPCAEKRLRTHRKRWNWMEPKA